ncbi:MAG TPA: hypothetical protein VGK23_01055 [Methanomassiliicoccales archaeon]|jgi:hypothetical protein
MPLPDIFLGSTGPAGFALVILSAMATTSAGMMLLLGVTGIGRRLRLLFGCGGAVLGIGIAFAVIL